jgi:hypothetical protein
MYNVTFKDAVKLTGKTKRTIQRYIGSGKLTFVTDDDGLKLFDRIELLESVGIVTPVTHDKTPINVTPFDNSQQLALISENNLLAKQQLEASNKTNELLTELVSLLKEKPKQVVLSNRKASLSLKWHTPKGVFTTCKDAANAEDVNRRTMSDWFSSNTTKYKDYFRK